MTGSLTSAFIIHQTHYEKSDWSRAFNQFTIACELDMINAIPAADIAFIMSSWTSAWVLSLLECSPQKQNGWMSSFCLLFKKCIIKCTVGKLSPPQFSLMTSPMMNTCNELTMVKMYWNTSPASVTLKTPNTQVIPKSGNKTTHALTPWRILSSSEVLSACILSISWTTRPSIIEFI